MINILNLTTQSQSGNNYKLQGFTAEEHCLLGLHYFNQLVSEVKGEIESNGKVNFNDQPMILRDDPVSSQDTVYSFYSQPLSTNLLS